MNALNRNENSRSNVLGWVCMFALCAAGCTGSSQLPGGGAGTAGAAGTGVAGGAGSTGGAGATGGTGGGSSGDCESGGKTYKAGESFPAADGCNTCVCQKDGRAVCTLLGCVATACGARAGDTCKDDEYCAYQAGELCGAADGESTCMKRPEVCPDLYSPVCGCDGVTYPSPCNANAAGVGVNSSGKCADDVCQQDIDCPQTDCACPPQPGIFCHCPVNGCRDGQCVDISATSCGGIAGAGCGKSQFCDFAPAAQCGAGDQTGTCKVIPQACDTLYQPVCGCDGKTYSNDCDANGHGVSVASSGECK